MKRPNIQTLATLTKLTSAPQPPNPLSPPTLCRPQQVSQQAPKCIPAMVCPELTEQIRREVAASLHQRKGDFTCYFLTDLVTFTLPAGQSAF